MTDVFVVNFDANPAPKGSSFRGETLHLKKGELKRLLNPGLRAVFGVTMPTSFVPQIKPKKGDKE